MTRMTGPDCAVMCNLINTHTHTHTPEHFLIKELAIRRVEHRLETHSNKSQHLAEGAEVAHARRRSSFVLQQELSFRTRHHLCRQGVAFASTRQLRSQDPVLLHVHRTEGVTESEGQEAANGVGSGIEVGGGNKDGSRGGGGNGDVDGDWDGDGARSVTGKATGVEANKGAKDGSGDGRGDGAGTGTGMGVKTRGRTQDGYWGGSGDGNESRRGYGNGDENGNRDGNKDGIGEGGGEAKKYKKPHKSCRHDQALFLFLTRHYLGRQGVVLAGTRQLSSQGLVPVHAHRTEGITGSKRLEGSNGVGSGIGVGAGTEV